MKRLFGLLLFMGAFVFANAQNRVVKIIPEPVAVQQADGDFLWDKNVAVQVQGNDAGLLQTVGFFLKQINIVCGTKSAVQKSLTPGKKALVVVLNPAEDHAIGSEGYTLKVQPNLIKLSANKPSGIFYGLQTLMQLLPPDASGNAFVKSSFQIPCVAITDYPRFGWRGLMLDVSRHFFNKGDVERYIDEMAKYKYNVFHWHLSDDQGWRIEIKSLPNLTKTGAWGVPRTGRWNSFALPQPGEKATQGGFYTQEDVKEIIRYAQDRFITIVPEVDVPAHSLALIASYPGLSCTQQQYPVNSGWSFYKKDDNVLCVGNDSVFLMLDKIFTEIAQLFPGKYIHVGGDEAYKGFWEQCPKCQKRMQAEHLKNVEELQSYFVKRMEKMLLAKGKKLIGWDEILEGGLAPEATVMSWRGIKGGIQAAKQNHHVVMSPWDNCYLDLYQGDPAAEPPTYGLCRLSASYNYEPVPDSVDAKYILGGQGNLWSESVYDVRHAEYMTWPRALALAEVFWSPKSKKNWDDFTGRMEAQFPRMDAAHIKYARSVYDPIITAQKADNADSLQVQLGTEIKGLDIYYTFDESNPDNFYPKYNGAPLVFPAGAADLKLITYREGKPVGKQITVSKGDLQKRIKK
ncbi:MAG: family 20 glycosylhydrolase [Niabella sp.]|nr:family 20 glycosylhydrolase [Niabella sp.]